MYVYACVCLCVCVCVYTYIYIYIYTEREPDTETERPTEERKSERMFAYIRCCYRAAYILDLHDSFSDINNVQMHP